MEGAKPLPRPPQRAKSPNATKRSGREGPTARWAVGPRGTLSRGSPQDAVLHLQRTNKKRASKGNEQRFYLLAQFYSDAFNAENPTGTFPRRRAACRAAIEAWCEVLGRGGRGATACRRWRGFSLWKMKNCVMPQFRRNCGRGNRGRPAGRLSFCLGCARGATSEDSRSAERDLGALPLRTLPAF